MNADSFFTRRNFIQSSAVAIGANTLINNASGLVAKPVATSPTSSVENGLKGRHLGRNGHCVWLGLVRRITLAIFADFAVLISMDLAA